MIRKIALFLFIALIVLGGTVLFGLARVLQSPGHLQESLTAQIEDRFGARLSFQEAGIHLAPFPVLRIKGPRLESMNEEAVPDLAAEEAQFSLRFLPLLWGEAQLSGLKIRGGEGTFWGISLKEMEFKVKGLNPGRFAPFEWRAKGSKGQKILKGKGNVALSDMKGDGWRGLGLRGELLLQSFSLAEEMGPRFLKRLAPLFQSSQWDAALRFEKEKGGDWVTGGVQFQARNLAPQNPGTFSLAGEGKLQWDFKSHLLELKRASLKVPFAEVEGMGIFNLETREIKEARLIGRKAALQEFIRLFPRWDTLLPLGTGFSGESEFDLTLRGTLDYLSLHANWNLTPAVLTHGKFFSKPKDFPMGINFDLLLKEGSNVSGDLSTRMGGSVIKGALVSLDLGTGEGELTLLTNKFELEDWSKLLTPLAPYRMTGSAKILLSLKGNLTEFGQTQKMWNLSLDKAALVSPSGRDLEVSGHFDASPLNLKIQEAVFKSGDSSLELAAEIYNLQTHPQGKIRITSPHLSPFVLSGSLREFHSLPHAQRALTSWRKFERILRRFFPREISVEDLTLTLESQAHKLILQQMEFQALGGGFSLKGERDWSLEKPGLWIEIGLDQISLVRYFEGMNLAGQGLEGNLFFTGRFQAEKWKKGEISKAWAGEGNLSITNGEWNSLNLLLPLQDVPLFEGLAPYRRSSTPFHDLKAAWRYKDGKFSSEDFLLHSEDLWVEGEGNLSLKGVLNSRLEVYFSRPLTVQMFRSWKAASEDQGKQLGPIPLLLVGNLMNPELRPDERSFENFLQAVEDRRFRKVLREPFRD